MKMRNRVIFAMFMLLAVLLLCGFEGKAEENLYLELPGMVWGMTLDETMEAFGVTRETADLLNEFTAGAVFTIDSGYEILGEATERIIFNFIDPKKGGGMPVLCAIDVQYPQDADMDEVIAELERLFGKPAEKISRYGLFQALSDEQLPREDYIEAENLKLWAAPVLEEVISEEESEAYQILWEDLQPGLNEENWQEFSEIASLVTVVCASGEQAFPKFDKNGVSLDAYNLIVYQELEERFDKTEK